MDVNPNFLELSPSHSRPKAVYDNYVDQLQTTLLPSYRCLREGVICCWWGHGGDW